MKGEEFLPTALASMTAKYLRELSMRAFNEFWCARVPGLRPTAGYPGDAPRFKQRDRIACSASWGSTIACCGGTDECGMMRLVELNCMRSARSRLSTFP